MTEPRVTICQGGEPPERNGADRTARYEYGRIVTNAKEVGEKVEVVFRDVRYGHRKEGLQSDGDDQAGKLGSLQADFLVAADGPSSSLRRLLLPPASRRTYAGYVAFRGTVPEIELSAATEQIYVGKFTFFHPHGTQILAYTIPEAAGTLEKGRWLVNWVWYCNYEESSREYEELMTDTDGVKDRC